MAYTIITDKIETRSYLNDNKKKEYVVRGYASIPNMKDIKAVVSDGNKLRPLKSMFTKKAIDSMLKQAKSRKIFVDTEHQTAYKANIKKIMSNIEKETGKELTDYTNYIDSMLNNFDIPFAKLFDMQIDDKGLFVDTRLNPDFRELDDNHKKFFDSVWNSIQNKFINGLSINFIPTKVTEEYVEGDKVDMIDDVDFLGISYTGQPALAENSITEVALRSMLDFRTKEKIEVREMIDNNTKPAEQASNPSVNNAELDRLKQELAAKEAEIAKFRQSELDKQKQEQSEVIIGLQNKLDEQSKKIQSIEQEKAQWSTVQQNNKYEELKKPKTITEQELQLKLQEITRGHNEWKDSVKKYGYSRATGKPLDGIGKLIKLQGEFGLHSIGLSPEANFMLARQGSDITTKRDNR